LVNKVTEGHMLQKSHDGEVRLWNDLEQVGYEWHGILCTQNEH
jgi:hypothetical protein